MSTADSIQDRTEFLEAATSQAFEVTDPDMSDFGRKLIHCGVFIGADWDLSDVLSEIRSARSVEWHEGLAGHDLSIVDESGKRRVFQVERP